MNDTPEKHSSMPPDDDRLRFRLYVAGTAPHSVRAIANFRLLAQEHFPDRYTLEIIDVFEEPLRALADGILLTPTLVKLTPPPCTVVGNLSDMAAVALALGL
ncbi:MAG: circadian clock KaiB family protein [Pseudomonadota bacterium]